MTINPHSATFERYVHDLMPREREVLIDLRLGRILTEHAVASYVYGGDIGNARTFLRVCEHLGLVTRLIVEDYIDRYIAGPRLDDVVLEAGETSDGRSAQQ